MKRTLLSLLLSLLPLSLLAANTNEEINRLRETADSLHSVGRTDSAAVVAAKAVKLAEKSGDRTQIVGTHSAQGVFLRSLGRIEEALASYDAALAIVTSKKFREKPDQEAVEEAASLYINLAVLNLDMQHKEDAVKNALTGGEWVEKSPDPAMKSMIYGVAGSVLTACGKFEEALQFQDKAYRNAMLADDKDAAFRASTYTMLAADRLGRKSEAAEWRAKCKELMPDIDSMMSKLLYYQAECSISLKNNDNREAIHWFDRILSLDGIESLPFVEYDCYNNLHQAYAGLGEYEEAYRSLLRGNELRDTLQAREKDESLRELTVKYETKETQLALAQSEARRANALMWLFAVVGLLLLSAILFSFYAGRQRRRRQREQAEYAELRADMDRRLTEQYIEGLEEERRRMAAELHDGVCNDLLAIEMKMASEKDGESLDEMEGMVKGCRESVRRISHALMPPEFSYATLDEVMRYFVVKQNEVSGVSAEVVYESENSGEESWRKLPDSVAFGVYRIAQEAVANALRHSGASKIIVRLTLSAEKLSLTVTDNGTFRPNKKRGVGIDSIRRRARSIGGEAAISTPEEGGTEVRFTLDL